MNMIAERDGPFRMMEIDGRVEHVLFYNEEIVGKAIFKGNVWVALLQNSDYELHMLCIGPNLGQILLKLWDSRHQAHTSRKSALH